MKTSSTREYHILRNLIKKDGSTGAIHHLINTTEQINNAYNEDGEEIPLTDPKYKKTKVHYSSKRIQSSEQSQLSLHQHFYRYSIIFDEDYEINKSDLFEDINGLTYPIEQIGRLGDRGGEVLYQLFCRTD